MFKLAIAILISLIIGCVIGFLIFGLLAAYKFKDDDNEDYE